MDATTARRSATNVGLITLPIGIALVAAPSRAGNRLGAPEHSLGLRLIGVADLALVPGLLAGRLRWRWMTARAGLNLVIATYCLHLVRRERATGAMVGAAAMVVATIADTRMIAALRRAR